MPRDIVLRILFIALLLFVPARGPLLGQAGEEERQHASLHILAIGADEYDGITLEAAVPDTRALSEALRQSVARAGTQMLESEPRAGSFGGDEPGSDFVLVASPARVGSR